MTEYDLAARDHEANPEYFARDWERAWNQARELVMKRAAAGELAGAVLPDGAARPALKAMSGIVTEWGWAR